MLWNNKNCCIKDWICLFHKTLLSFFERLELREERSGTIPLIKKLFLILFGNSQKKIEKNEKDSRKFNNKKNISANKFAKI